VAEGHERGGAWNLALEIAQCILSNNPTYENIMFITECNERENSPQSVDDIRLTIFTAQRYA